MKMIKTATTGMITMAMILLFGSTGFAAGNKGTITVSATVLGKLSQTTVRQEKMLTITSENIGRGFVDIPAGTILQVKSNDLNGYFLNFFIDGMLVEEAQVNVNGRSVSVPAGVGLIHQPFPGISGETLQITYRLFLSPEMKPGTYPWPIAVSASLI